MKDNSGIIHYRDHDYMIVFNFNVMEAIQEEYGSLEAWGELSGGKNGEANAKAVIFGFTAMINEGIDIQNEENGTDIKPMTLKQVGRMISEVGLEQATDKLHDTVIASTRSAEKNS